MTIRISALACALCLVGCGGDKAPAQDPSSVPTPSEAPDAGAAPTASITNTGVDDGMGTSVATRPSSPVTPSAPEKSMAASAPVTTDDAPAPTKDADNTKKNERDRGGTLTPMDQGNGRSELQISAAIRKSLMADSSLSFTAKNVKIITVGGKVTLRGTVNSAQERSTIEDLAKRTAGVSEVDDQLEVKK